MKRLATFFAIALTVGSLCSPATAKQRLPVTVRCTNANSTSATVTVKLQASATSFAITVGGTGSVVMDELARRAQAVSKSQEVSVPVTFTSGLTEGGLVVEVRGDFGHGVRAQVQTFSLVGGKPGSAVDVRASTRAGQTALPGIVLIPAKTTTEKR